MKKFYPDLNRLRVQIELSKAAFDELMDRDISIRSVRFRAALNPLILVDQCPGTDRMESLYIGQGVDSGGRFERRAAPVAGCQVEWRVQK